MNVYAQLNDEQVCFAISELNSPVDNDRLIPITSLNERYLGALWRDGQFWTVNDAGEPDVPLTEKAL